ncbi:ThiF family adenylyltransferase, partial [Klebsiella pneumoniae]|uniref:ThiF family adenylyltransferase n=1 Tax=Klebsiella pneumoniae TaxID=573 RepID=UPI00390890A1
MGRLRLVDADRVELSNLQRQIIHAQARIGEFKAESAAAGVGADLHGAQGQLAPVVGDEPAAVGGDVGEGGGHGHGSLRVGVHPGNGRPCEPVTNFRIRRGRWPRIG